MQYFRNALSRFNVGSQRQHSGGGMEGIPRYDGSRTNGEQHRSARSREMTRDGNDPLTGKSRRQSKFWDFSRRSGGMTAERVVDQRKSIRDQQREEQFGALLQEQRELHESISRWNGKVERRKETLASLQEKDNAEKWEDELFETRMKELDSARAVIHTQSSVHGEDVRDQIKALNQEIIQIAKIAASTSVSRPAGSLESVSKYLGDNLLLIFEQDHPYLRDQQVVQAILQIFLTESCIRVIDSWHLGKPNLDELLNRLYGRIRTKEEQAVAGKWRQITISQLRNEELLQIYRQYADQRARQVIELSAAAGWGGHVSDVQHRLQKMIDLAATIRTNVKVGIISADLRPWIASYRDRYDFDNMKDVGKEIPGLRQVTERPESCHVLGSTKLGLRLHKTGDEPSAEFEGLRTRPRVLLHESFWEVKRRSSRHAPRD